MRPSSLFKTATFRLALSYASLFAVSSAVLFGAVYWAIQEFESQQIRRSIETEVSSLEVAEESGSHDALTREMTERTASHSHHPFEYALVDANGARLAGDLPATPSQLGWQFMEVPGPTMPDGDSSQVLYVFGSEIGDGQRLFVAKDSEPLEELRETVAGTFALGSAVTMILAILGGAAVSALFMQRIETINRAASRVMDGAIGERMPVIGTNDEFDRLSVNLNQMLDRIESLVANLKRVSSDIAHDLRTPLTHLRNELEQARSQARSVPEFAAVIERSIAETDGILSTFGALLRIAEIESGGQRANFADVDMSSLMNKLVETYAPVAEDEGFNLSGSIEAGLRLRGDQAMLTQMIANLCENAMRHTPAGTRIELGLVLAQGDALCTVADNGPGVTATEREQIFRPFYRLDQSRSTPGTGLGLALVKAIAELHGGAVAVADGNPGARFEVRLPVRTAVPAIRRNAGRTESAPAIQPSRQIPDNV